MVVIVAAKLTPNAVGIGQIDDKIFPFSSCCSEPLKLAGTMSGKSLLLCSKCGAAAAISEGPATPTSFRLAEELPSRHVEPLLQLYFSLWTGWPEEKLNVKVDYS